MKDFFVSYTSADIDWAEWIAFVLEEAGYTTVIQEWDFRPGNNFVVEMQNAALESSRTIAVLSSRYLESKMTAAEWASAFAQDADGREAKLVPVMIEKCGDAGLLNAIVQIRLYDFSEDIAKDKLLAGVSSKRRKPLVRPKFPGRQKEHPVFPGQQNDSSVSSTASVQAKKSVLPALKEKPTDLEKRKFLRSGFELVRDLFETNLTLAAEVSSRIQQDFQSISAKEFVAELFVDEKCKSRCRIWLANMAGSAESIYYYSGLSSFPENTYNESISVPTNGPLRFEMHMGFSQLLGHDSKNLTAEQVGEILWKRFTEPLSR
jgi:hypothetical protein